MCAIKPMLTDFIWRWNLNINSEEVKESILNFQAITHEANVAFCQLLVFWGKSQTDFSSFMFHIQATSQQTLVFTPMLIKVNDFVVWGHWYKTCALLVYVMYKSSKFQDASRTNWWLTYVVYGDSKHFFQFMFELLLLFYAKCAHDS